MCYYISRGTQYIVGEQVQEEQVLRRIRAYIQKHPNEPEAAEDALAVLVGLREKDKQICYEWNLWLRNIAETAVKTSKDMKVIPRFFEVAKKTYLLCAQDDFDSYCIYLEWNREPQKRFYVPRRRVLKPIGSCLQELADDKIDLLAISLPPGVGKTTLAIFYLTWLGGKRPDMPMLGGSHSNAFLRGVYDECLRIMQPDGEYLWKDVFPSVEISKTNAQDMMIDLGKQKRFTTFEFSSIGSGNAGKVRAENLLYCDDLCSGIEEALSKDRMDNLWTKYTTDLRQRKIGNCKELHIATRWSVHDVIGRLERAYEDSDRAKFLRVPALDERGESNFDYANHAGFTTAFYIDMKETMDDISWRALYMNEPIEREGLVYHPDDLRRYYELPAEEPDAILGVCDTAEGGGDDTFLPVGYVYGNDHYIDDCVCSNALPEITDDLCADMLVRHKVKLCQFESNSAGGRTADVVQEKVKKKGGITHITKKRTTANKETKIIVNSAWVKEHCLFKDEKVIQRGSSYDHMIKKLCSHTMSGKNKHDDVPDGMAQYAIFAQSLGANKIEVMKRPF
jgi:predicted phage terminase large subunit-like protein